MSNMNITNLVESIRNTNVFAFRYNDGEHGSLRLSRAIGEFLIQIQCDTELDYRTDDVAGIRFRAVNRDCLHRIMGVGVILISSDYANVYITSNGWCIVDLRDVEGNPDDGGYFTSQPGTAFGRVLGQGFTPVEVTDDIVPNIYQHIVSPNPEPSMSLREWTNHPDPWDTESINDVTVHDDGHITIHEEFSDGSPREVIYGANAA